MSANTVVIHGVVKPDGTLEVEGKVPLAAGRVQVIVQPIPDLPEGDPYFDMLKEIWAVRARAGLMPRSVAEVEAQRRRLREETEQEVREAGRIQEECRHERERGAPPVQEDA